MKGGGWPIGGGKPGGGAATCGGKKAGFTCGAGCWTILFVHSGRPLEGGGMRCPWLMSILGGGPRIPMPGGGPLGTAGDIAGCGSK